MVRREEVSVEDIVCRQLCGGSGEHAEGDAMT